MTCICSSALFMLIAEGLTNSRDEDLTTTSVLERLEESTAPEGPGMGDHIATKVFLSRVLRRSGRTREAKRRCVSYHLSPLRAHWHGC